MRIGIIGSGRVGYSVGRYLSDNQMDVTGFYDRHHERAQDAAAFCKKDSFQSLEELVYASDTLFLTTQDSEIRHVWDCIREMSITNKIICHFSGSLSSVVFQGIERTGAVCCSIHPMLAFSDKYASYLQLKNAFFTVEGDAKAVSLMQALFQPLGNTVVEIDASKKALYHCAASVLSNQVIAVLDSGYRMLEQVGFSKEEVLAATSSLITGNVANVIATGCENALTGPIERGDVQTVRKHLQCVPREDLEMYVVLGKKLLAIAKRKHPEQNYDEMEQILSEEANKEEFV